MVPLVLSLVFVANADGIPRLRLVGTSVTPLYTNGVRWAAYEPTTGTTRIMDARRGQWFSRRDPEGCAGGLVAVGTSDLLYLCTHPPCRQGFLGSPGGCSVQIGSEAQLDARYMVEGLASGAAEPVAGEEHLPFDDSEGGGFTALTRVGSQWVQGETNTLYSGYVFFLNWHDGELRTERLQPDGEPPQPDGEHLTVDLDSPNLTKPICAPLTRIWASGIHSWGPLPFAYAPPFAATGYEDGKVTLERCGSQAARSLPGQESDSLQIGAGILSWIAANPRIKNNDDTMYLTRLQSHAHNWHGRVYTLAGPEVGAHFMLLAHTRTTVYETAMRRGPTRIYAARIP